MKSETIKTIRNTFITLFVIVWTILFHYVSIGHFYLEPLAKKPLPQVKFLFPPAGWIMFWNVDDQFSHAEVYGIKDGKPQLIDPHDIIPTRFVGFDNIYRGVLGTVTYRTYKQAFCQYMERKFPYFDNFMVSGVYYPSLTESRYKRHQGIIYQCR